MQLRWFFGQIPARVQTWGRCVPAEPITHCEHLQPSQSIVQSPLFCFWIHHQSRFRFPCGQEADTFSLVWSIVLWSVCPVLLLTRTLCHHCKVLTRATQVEQLDGSSSDSPKEPILCAADERHSNLLWRVQIMARGCRQHQEFRTTSNKGRIWPDTPSLRIKPTQSNMSARTKWSMHRRCRNGQRRASRRTQGKRGVWCLAATFLTLPRALAICQCARATVTVGR